MDIERYVRNLPPVTDANRDYWQGCDDGTFRLQTCTACGLARYPEMPACANCLSLEFRWLDSSGRGSLWSWIVMHQNYLRAFADELPYIVAMVHLDEGPMMIATVADTGDLSCDQPLQVVFDRVGDRTIPKFEVAE